MWRQTRQLRADATSSLYLTCVPFAQGAVKRQLAAQQQLSEVGAFVRASCEREEGLQRQVARAVEQHEAEQRVLDALLRSAEQEHADALDLACAGLKMLNEHATAQAIARATAARQLASTGAACEAAARQEQWAQLERRAQRQAVCNDALDGFLDFRSLAPSVEVLAERDVYAGWRARDRALLATHEVGLGLAGADASLMYHASLCHVSCIMRHLLPPCALISCALMS